MAWFANHYTCDRCDKLWTDEWSAMCDDGCPYCGARHMSPIKSDDLTHVISEENGSFVVGSPATAEYHADYRELAWFRTRPDAERFLSFYA